MNGNMASRRSLLRAGGAAVATAATANAATVASAQDPYDGWLDDTDNYDGTVDARGEDEVAVAVGAGDDGVLFDPPAILVDPGATVVWEWTGEGGEHNVVDDDGEYESELSDEEGHTFEHTFEEDGVSRYFCEPHEALGMKGVVAVGDVEGVEDDLVDGDGDEGGGDGDEGGGDGDEGGDGNDGAEAEGGEAGLREFTTGDYVAIGLGLALGLAFFVPLLYAAATAEID